MQRKLVTNDKGVDGMHAPVTRENIVEKLAIRALVQLSVDDVLIDAPLLSYGLHKVPVRVGDEAVEMTVRIDQT